MSVRVVNKTVEDMERFNNIWMPSWIESGYELESYIIPGTKRFIFYNDKSDYGSLVIVPYNYGISPVNDNFPFHYFNELHNKKVVEIDKLAILDSSRGNLKKLYEIFSFIVTLLDEEKWDFAIGLLNPRVYEVFVWRLKLPIKRLVTSGYENLPYYPVLIEVKSLLETNFGKKVLAKTFVTVE